MEFGSANYSSTISENDANDLSYSRNTYGEKEHQDMNESQNSSNSRNVMTNGSNMGYDSYNSFNFESRVADYGKKTNTIYRTEEFNSANSQVGPSYIPPSKNNYVPPVQKRVSEYTKDDYPSNPTEENQSYHFSNKKEFISNVSNSSNVSNTSFSEYEFQTTNKDFEKSNLGNNKVSYDQQNTVEYNSAYDSNNNYFMSGMDPK